MLAFYAFFRFFNTEKSQEKVTSTSAISLIISSFGLLGIGFLFRNQISELIGIELQYLNLVFIILLLDALVIIPFAWLRATAQSMRYAVIKIMNVAINLGLNIFLLLYLKELSYTNSLCFNICKDDFEINYIFISNLIASGITLLLLVPFYTKIKLRFNVLLWKKMNDWTLTGHQETYKRQGISFEKSYKESDYYLEGKNIAKTGLEKKVFFTIFVRRLL